MKQNKTTNSNQVSQAKIKVIKHNPQKQTESTKNIQDIKQNSEIQATIQQKPSENLEKSIDLDENSNKKYHRNHIKVNKKRKKSLKGLFILLFSALFHYSDLFTDIFFTLQVLKLSYSEEYSESRQQILFIRGFILLYSLINERIEQFLSCRQLLLFIKQQKNQKQSKLSLKDNIIILLSMMTFTDFYYYFKTYLVNGNIFSFMFKKRLADLCTENFLFFGFSSVSVLDKIINENTCDIFLIFSSFLSLNSCIIAQFQLYSKRINKSKKYKPKKFNKFTSFPVELQLKISNPYRIQLLKFQSYIPDEHRIYFKKSKTSIIKERNSKNLTNFLENFKQKPISEQKKQKKRQFIPKFLIKPYLFIYILIHIQTQSYLAVMQGFTPNAVRIKNFIIISFIFHLPQILLYAKIKFKTLDSKKEKAIFFLYWILKLPISAVVGLTTFGLPLIVQEIPFIEETKETWLHNFYPSSYIDFAQISQQCYMVYLIVNAMKTEEFYTEIVNTEQKLNNILEPGGIFYCIYLYILVIFFINLIFKFLRIIYNSLQIKQKKMKKNKDTPEINLKVKQQISSSKEQENSIIYNNSLNMEEVLDKEIILTDRPLMVIEELNDKEQVKIQEKQQNKQHNSLQNYTSSTMITKSVSDSKQLDEKENNINLLMTQYSLSLKQHSTAIEFGNNYNAQKDLLTKSQIGDNINQVPHLQSIQESAYGEEKLSENNIQRYEFRTKSNQISKKE